MSATTHFSTSRKGNASRDRTTHGAGYDHVTRRIARENPDYMALIDWWIDLDATPRSGRCNFWQGMEEAVRDAMVRFEMAALGVQR